MGREKHLLEKVYVILLKVKEHKKLSISHLEIKCRTNHKDTRLVLNHLFKLNLIKGQPMKTKQRSNFIYYTLTDEGFRYLNEIVEVIKVIESFKHLCPEEVYQDFGKLYYQTN